MYLYYAKDYIRGLMAETHVRFQSIRSTKTLLAHITLVRFLVRVNTHVDSQSTISNKHIITNIPIIKFLDRVNPNE